MKKLFFKLISDHFCYRFFKYRILYQSNVIRIYNTKLKNHFESMSKIYPNYKDKIIEFSSEKDKKRLWFLFQYPYICISLLHLKFWVKNLWHKLFW